MTEFLCLLSESAEMDSTGCGKMDLFSFFFLE